MKDFTLEKEHNELSSPLINSDLFLRVNISFKEYFNSKNSVYFWPCNLPSNNPLPAQFPSCKVM